jgi:hypothetical protein
MMVKSALFQELTDALLPFSKSSNGYIEKPDSKEINHESRAGNVMPDSDST